MPPLHQLSTAQLRQALQLSEQIDTMQRKLEAILGGPEPVESGAAGAKAKGKGGRGGKRTMSVEGREKIAAAARARWAKVKAGAGKPSASAAKPGKTRTVAAKPGHPARKAAAPKKRGGLSDEGRAKLSASMKARWEARKKGTAA